jgi:hypothetical protein
MNDDIHLISLIVSDWKGSIVIRLSLIYLLVSSTEYFSFLTSLLNCRELIVIVDQITLYRCACK